MSILTSLPEEVAGLILVEWLSFAQMGRLDTAHCNRHHRKLFLAVAYDSGFLYDNISIHDKMRDYMEIIRSQGIEPRWLILDVHTKWLMLRGAAVRGMMMPMRISLGDCEKHLEKRGKTLAWMSFEPNINGDSVHAPGFLEQVIRLCPNVQFLQMGGNFTEYDQILIAGWHSLQHVVMATRMTEKAILAISRGCKSLTKVTSHILQTYLTPGTFAPLFQHPNLQALDIRDTCCLINTYSLKRLAEYCPQLREITLQAYVYSDGWAAMALGCTQLEHLDLKCSTVYNMPVFDPHLRIVAERGKLRTLTLPNLLPREGSALLVHVAQHSPLLHTLAVPTTEVLDSVLDALSKHCPRLKVLEVTGTSLSGTAVCNLLRHCTSLRRLHMRKHTLSYAEVKSLRTMPWVMLKQD